MSVTATLPERYNASMHASTANIDRRRAGRRSRTSPTDRSLTYDELLAQVQRAPATCCARSASAREERVLLVLDDTTAFPVVFLGAMRLGAVPVPVSPLDRADNFRHYVDDTYARVVVTDAGTCSTLREALAGRDVTFLVGARPGGRAWSTSTPGSPPRTTSSTRPPPTATTWPSGSTARARPASRRASSTSSTTSRSPARATPGSVARRCARRTSRSRRRSSTTPTGSATASRSRCGSARPRCSCAGPPKPEPLLAILRERRPTVFFSVPALYGALVARRRGPTDALASVRMCVSAAEALSPRRSPAAWETRFGLAILDGIGSTEMLHIFCSNRPGAVVRGTTGRPVPGYELRIVDEDGARPRRARRSAALEVRGDSLRGLLLAPAREDEGCMRGEWFSTGDRYRAHRGRRLRLRRPQRRHAQDRRPLGVADRHGARRSWSTRTCSASASSAITVDDASRIAAYVESRDGDPGRRRARRTSCARCAGSACAATSTRTSCASSTTLPRTLTGKVQRFRLRERMESSPA